MQTQCRLVIMHIAESHPTSNMRSPLDYEIWKYYPCTSKAHANVLQNVPVRYRSEDPPANDGQRPCVLCMPPGLA